MPTNNGVLFVCSHNSARSQMAHGWLKQIAGDRFRVYSAGVDPGTLNPLAVRAMAEVGIDIADHVAEGIEDYLGKVSIYYLIIVCDQASMSCPRLWPGARERHQWRFDDPSAARGSDEERLAVFRRVRDEIKQKLEDWLASQNHSVTTITPHNPQPKAIDMNNELTDAIREKYGETARSGLSSDQAGVRHVAEAFGYSAEELAAIPAEANMGLSCGNPVALANLRPGEVVVDLGSGGGLDVFLAAQKVGPTGRVIGIDMTPDMVALARRNAERGPASGGGLPYRNVEFKLGDIDRLPLPDASVDVVISNCVINLAPDKDAVFAEMFRVLRPGGRVAVSDITLKGELPGELASNVAAWCGCVAGAIRIEDFEKGMRVAGFQHVAIVDTGADLTAYAAVEGQAGCCSPAPAAVSLEVASSACCSPGSTATGGGCCTPAPAAPTATPMHRDLGELFEKYDINAYAASVKVFAIKAE